MTRKTLVCRSGALLAATTLLALSAATPAFAASSGNGDVDVVNTETVQVYMNADGEIQTKRVYEQVAMTGKGKVHLDNPISTTGLRNLDGFSGFDAKSGHQVIDTKVDGEKKLRSVSDFTGQLPLDIATAYELDGKPVEPGDLVGKSGHLVVTFDVKNTTTQTQQVSFPDGRGGTITKMAQVPVPVVGSLSTGAPANFTNVTSKQANLAGDGKGGTKLSFTMTLFPPVGKTTTSFSYEADVTDAVVPRIDVSALPVNPLEVPTFASAADSYQGGADTGAKLTDGAVQIDSNLLKLRDGAAELLSGLIKLHNGAGDLSDGLNDEAAPGAAKLADGAAELSFGLVKLDDGAGQLNDGAGQLATGTEKLSAGTGKLDVGAKKLADGSGTLSNGTGDALAGSRKLTTGLAQISGGLGQLADADKGLPAASAGIEKLKVGVDKLTAGIALSPDFNPQDPSTIRTVLDGLTALKLGLGSQAADGTLLNGAARIKGGLGLLAHGDGSATNPGLAGIQTGLNGAKLQLDPKVAAGGDLDQLQGTLLSIANNNAACSTDPQCKGTLTALAGKVAQSKTDLVALRDGLAQAVAGLQAAVGAIDTQLIPGADQLTAGLNSALAGVNKLIAGVGSPSQDGTVLNGLTQLNAGLDQLAVGVTKAVAGISELNTGAADAYGGSGDLTNGLGRLDAGANQLSGGASQLASGTGELRDGAGTLSVGANKLSDGAGQLADGTGKANDGGKQVSDGASKLSDGLGAAADGSTQLADGLGTAAGGAPKLVDGATRLSKEGTKKLIAAGELTTAQYGEMVAVIKAGADRADAESMAYGAPKGAIGRTAYNYIIEGDDGEGTRNVARALGGLATLGAAGGLFFVRRRFLI